MGCFTDYSNNKDFSYEIQISNMKTSDCISECATKQYAYAGLRNDICSCGNSFGKHGFAAKCITKCAGDKKDLCGTDSLNDKANSVYEVLCKLRF